MSEKVIKAFHLKDVSRPVIIEPPKLDMPQDDFSESGSDSKEPMGPSPEEIQRILDEKTQEAEAKAEEMIRKAMEEADEIREKAENWAFDQVKKLNEDYESRMKEAQLKAKEIEEQSRQNGDRILKEAMEEAEKITKTSHQKGFESGREQGYQSGSEEVKRLIAVVHKISGELIARRDKILAETEKELIDLVLLISTKVIKSLTESQKRVVYDNIMAALSKMKVRAEVTLRVNPEDIYTVTKHKKDFIEMVEGVENIRILEDPNVDKGGCVVTSEFGSIDAKISTQLAEIEEQIRKLSPIKNEESF